MFSECIRYLRRIRAAARGHKSWTAFEPARIRIARELSEIPNPLIRQEAEIMFLQTVRVIESPTAEPTEQFYEQLGVGLTRLIDYLESNNA